MHFPVRFPVLFSVVALNQMEDRCLVHCGSVRPKLREGMISCTLLAKFVQNGAFRGAVITKSLSGVNFLVHCSSEQSGGVQGPFFAYTAAVSSSIA